jgi:hypothetical protein
VLAEIQVVAWVIDEFEGEHGMDGQTHFINATADGASEPPGLKPARSRDLLVFAVEDEVWER